MRLPDRKILELYSKNFLISTKNDLFKLLKNYQFETGQINCV